MPKEIKVLLPNREDKKHVVKFEVDDPRESREAIKNVYVSKEALKSLGDPAELEIIIRPKKEA